METPTENDYVGYYEAVEAIGSQASFSWQPDIYGLPYYQINVNGLLLSQERGETSWTLLGHLAKMDDPEARVAASRLLTTPFLFEDETGGNSAIRNTILAGISGMWTLTRSEDDVEWTYYFLVSSGIEGTNQLEIFPFDETVPASLAQPMGVMVYFDHETDEWPCVDGSRW